MKLPPFCRVFQQPFCQSSPHDTVRLSQVRRNRVSSATRARHRCDVVLQLCSRIAREEVFGFLLPWSKANGSLQCRACLSQALRESLVAILLRTDLQCRGPRHVGILPRLFTYLESPNRPLDHKVAHDLLKLAPNYAPPAFQVANSRPKAPS